MQHVAWFLGVVDITLQIHAAISAMWSKRENSLRGNAKASNYSAANGSASNAAKAQEDGEWESVQKRKKKTEKKPKENYVNGDGRYVCSPLKMRDTVSYMLCS